MHLFLKIFAVLTLEFLLFTGTYLLWHHQNVFFPSMASAEESLTVSKKENPPIVWVENPAKSEWPLYFKLDVPFTTQAPLGRWILPWEEFCEEASILMAVKYKERTGREKIELVVESMNPVNAAVNPLLIPKSEAAEEMLKIMRFEERVLGYHFNTGVSEVAHTLKTLYGVEAEIVEGATIENIKEELLRYRPVILPLSGKLLRNPYFQRGGPVYHMAVVVGYDDSDGTFITNEPGTRFGMGYRYGQELLFGAIRDWDERAEQLIDRKVMLVVK